ncbi:hypothetical protein [Algoriphagus antarcticus]|uniref:Uncharacterized protein n=1 Tax=Algoriphagus antarcticus TaxID=238540 RepID=A0A3E0DLB1_9BACT|nr:hypothetical protein [Algoriphagus antarcticus]REG83415.1 hypothetical protein C8N25_11860 [Algoriphagus antarcticus]
MKNKKEESNLTEEDLQALGAKKKNLRNDGGDDEMLRDRKRPADFAAADLDIPGEELDDAQERRGSEDEENNHYSLGTDHNENVDKR